MRQEIGPEIRMSPEDRAFFVQLGARIAALRKQRQLTQTQLGEVIGFSQQQVVSFEKGRRKVPASILPVLSKALGVTVEELLGIEAKPSKRGPAPKLQRQLEQLQQLPRSKQRFVSQMIDTVIEQAGR